ncbi:MAG TPA: hypothetical protein VMW72_10780 [Sedimentisphaerales bacterium]|nr:hypothetical protein [Sedimentisphaerales bacterium]
MADWLGQNSEAIEPLPVAAEEVAAAQELPQIPANTTAGRRRVILIQYRTGKTAQTAQLQPRHGRRRAAGQAKRSMTRTGLPE